MNARSIVSSGLASVVALIAMSTPTLAATPVQVGASGKTFASPSVACAVNATGILAPAVDAGLYQPKPNTQATVSRNGAPVATVTTANPVTTVWLANGVNTVAVSLNKKTSDSYVFTVPAGSCSTSGNTFSADGTLEYAASGKSAATVVAGCAWNGRTGQAQPFINLFDRGNYLLNVSVNGVPLTQLSATRPSTPVFLGAGRNVISAANASLSTDYYVRDGGSGTCTLP